MAATDIRDLAAIALTRRILLELGLEQSPDALRAEAAHVGALELWVHTPHPALGGRKPLDVFETAEGEQQIRDLLSRLVQQGDRHSDRGTSPDVQAGS